MKHWKAGKRTQAGERQKRKETDGKTAMRVSSVSIGVNLGLSLLKLLAGIIGHSGAMLSDAVHSASDVLSTLVVIAGVKLSEKKSDPHHPYGHERMECVAAILLAAFLTVIGTGIGCVHFGQRMDVLVYKGSSKKDSFRRFDGGCMASQIGFAVFHRSIYRHFGSADGGSDFGSGRRSGDQFLYSKSIL